MNKFVNYVSNCLLKETSFNLKDITHPDFMVYISFRDRMVDVLINDNLSNLMKRKYGANEDLLLPIFDSYLEKVRSVCNEKYNGYIPELTECEQFIYDKFMECDVMESEKTPGYTLYFNERSEILFVDSVNLNNKEPLLYIDYEKIWLKSIEMGVSDKDIRKICVHMLYEIPKRKVITSTFRHTIIFYGLYEIPKRKVSTSIPYKQVPDSLLYEIPK